VLNSPGDESQTFKLAYRQAKPPADEGHPEEGKIRTISPITFGLPRSLERHPTWACLLNILSQSRQAGGKRLCWNGRMKSSRFVSATIPSSKIPPAISQVALINPGPDA